VRVGCPASQGPRELPGPAENPATPALRARPAAEAPQDPPDPRVLRVTPAETGSKDPLVCPDPGAPMDPQECLACRDRRVTVALMDSLANVVMRETLAKLVSWATRAPPAPKGPKDPAAPPATVVKTVLTARLVSVVLMVCQGPPEPPAPWDPQDPQGCPDNRDPRARLEPLVPRDLSGPREHEERTAGPAPRAT